MTDGSRPTVTIVGVPMRRGSISGGRFDLAPAAILAALDRFVAHPPHEAGRITELGVLVERAEDMHEIAEMRPEDAFERIRRHVAVSFEDETGRMGIDRAVVLLGGDNSITRPGAHAIADELGALGVLTFDAHHDLRDTSNGLSNGNPIRALLQDGLPGRNVAQVGIQALANGAETAAVAREAGITVVTADEVRRRGMETITVEVLEQLDGRAEAIYVDLDVDVLDRAFAPGCPGSRPGGLSPHEVQAAMRACGGHSKVRALDIVEVDPERDVGDVTVLGAASFLLAFVAGLVARGDATLH